MNLKNAYLPALLAVIATATACSSPDQMAKEKNSSFAAVAETPSTELQPDPGVALHSFNVTSRSLSVDGLPVTEVNESTFAGYPGLAAAVAEASASDRVVSTEENTLELYVGSTLIMVIGVPSVGPPVLIYSRNGFHADSFEYSFIESDQDQGLMTGLLKFQMSECVDSGQGQDQGEKGQEKGQGEVCKVAVVSLSLLEEASPKTPDQGKCEKGQDQCEK